MRNIQKHLRLIECKYFRVYHGGAYALWEIDFGRTGYGELVICLGCVEGGHQGIPRKHKLVDWTYNKRIVPKTETWTNGIAY